MNAISRHPFWIGLGLAAAMAATRSHHMADLVSLPDASWAVFLLAGFYLGTGTAFAALLTLAGLVDFVAITWGGVSDFCISPAYSLLLPAYGALFLAGRWYAARHRMAWSTVAPLLTAAFSGTLVCELISSGGFYFFSGRFTATSMAEFGERFARYFPGSLTALAFYLTLAVVAHILLTLVATRATRIRTH